MSKPIVYIHPGIGKTATSAIQNIAMKEMKLSDTTRYFPLGLIGNVHNLLADNHPKYSKETAVNIYSEVEMLDKKFNYLISSEFLIYSSKECIKTLCDCLESNGFDIRLLFVIRDHKYLIESSYLQALKSGYGLIKGETLQDYADRNKLYFDFDLLINKWDLSKDQIKIIDYDKHGKNFVSVFFNELGVDINHELSKISVNNSISHIFSEVINEIYIRNPKLTEADRVEMVNLFVTLTHKYNLETASGCLDVSYYSNSSSLIKSKYLHV